MMLCVWTVSAATSDSITLRAFSLETGSGERVLHANFDRRRLADRAIGRLNLKFRAVEKQFDFSFEQSHPIFAPTTTIKMTEHGDGYVEVPTPSILSFSSPQNNAAITFINDTAVNGVVFQHGHAFDVVVSADLLVLHPVQHDVDCGLATFGGLHHPEQRHKHTNHGRLLSIADIQGWDDCYTGQSKTHVLKIGVGVTSGLYQSEFSEDLTSTIAWLASIVARSNVIYRRQMNIVIQVADLIVVNPSSTLPPWNNAGCSMTIYEQLAAVNPAPKAGDENVWRPPSKQAAWHIFDICADGKSPAGVGYQGSYQPSREYELALGANSNGPVVQVDGLKSPLISLTYPSSSSSDRTYVFTSKDPSQKIYIKHRSSEGQALENYVSSSVSGQGTNKVTFSPKPSDKTKKDGDHKLFYQLGDGARGSLQVTPGACYCVTRRLSLISHALTLAIDVVCRCQGCLRRPQQRSSEQVPRGHVAYVCA